MPRFKLGFKGAINKLIRSICEPNRPKTGSTVASHALRISCIYFRRDDSQRNIFPEREHWVMKMILPSSAKDTGDVEHDKGEPLTLQRHSCRSDVGTYVLGTVDVKSLYAKFRSSSNHHSLIGLGDGEPHQ